MVSKIPRPSKRAQRAEGEGEISEQENLILGQIRNYFDIPFSRHFKKFDENVLANRILWMIANADLPPWLNLYYFSDPIDMDPNKPGPIPREDIDNFFVAVGNYIQDLKQDDFDWQVAKKTADMERQRKLYSENLERPREKKTTRIVKKLKKVVGR